MNEAMKNNFISWCKTRDVNPQKLKGTGQFIGAEVQSAWMGWQAALSQQQAQPTVKDCLTVPAQPSCEPVAWKVGKMIIENERIAQQESMGVYPMIALYAAPPDCEALRAENERLKEAEEMLIRVISERDALKARNVELEPAFEKASKACSSALLALAHTSLDNPLYSDAYEEVNAMMPIFMELRKK